MKHIFSLLALIPVLSYGQIKAPNASPGASISQEIGFSKVTVEYNRPQLKGRDMFTDLTREGEVWRTGANMSTRLTIEGNVTINNQEVPEGKYSIYSIPGKKEWTIIINKKIQWGTVYDEAEDLMRFKVPTESTKEKTESFTFNFTDVTEDSALLGFSWENSSTQFKIASPVHDKVVAQIKEVMADPASAQNGDFFTASNYYMEKGLDAAKALEWANEYVKRESDKYWAYRLQARALAANGQYSEAIKLANKSTEMAREAGNMDYVHINGKSVAEWTKASK